MESLLDFIAHNSVSAVACPFFNAFETRIFGELEPKCNNFSHHWQEVRQPVDVFSVHLKNLSISVHLIPFRLPKVPQSQCGDDLVVVWPNNYTTRGRDGWSCNGHKSLLAKFTAHSLQIWRAKRDERFSAGEDWRWTVDIEYLKSFRKPSSAKYKLLENDNDERWGGILEDEEGVVEVEKSIQENGLQNSFKSSSFSWRWF